MASQNGGEQATLWVGSLAASLTTKDISKFFSAYGDVKSVRLGAQQPAGFDQYVFVTFASSASASAALVELDGEQWEGVSGTRPLKIEFSRTTYRAGSAAESHAPEGAAGEVDWDVEVTPEEVKAANSHLWVGNLRAHPSQATLERVAARFGRLHGVRVFQGKLYGFVDYTSPQSAAKALKALQSKAVPALSGNHTLAVEYRKEEGSKSNKASGGRPSPSQTSSQLPKPAAAETAGRSPTRRGAAASAATGQPAASTLVAEEVVSSPEPAMPQTGEELLPVQGYQKQHWPPMQQPPVLQPPVQPLPVLQPPVQPLPVLQPPVQPPQHEGGVSREEDDELGLPPHLLLLQQHAAATSAATAAAQPLQQPVSQQIQHPHPPPPPHPSHSQPHHIPQQGQQQPSAPPPPLSPPLLHCDGCGASEAIPVVVLRTCTGCQAVTYCGPECQMAAWQRAHHADCASLVPLMRMLQLQPQLAPTLWAILDEPRGREARLMRQVLTALAAEQRMGML